MSNLYNTVAKWYNICFTLGDYSNDGHGHSENFHMIANYSLNEINIAYKNSSDILGFDFCQECCAEYEQYYIKPEYTKILVDKGIIEETYVNKDCEYYPIGAYSLAESCATEEFIEIFIKIIQLTLPNFKMKERELKEDCLSILEGAGYGLFSL